MPLFTAAAPFLMCAALGLAAADGRARRLFNLTKPLVALSLILLIGTPQTLYQSLVVAGLFFAAVGDALLLSDSPRAFLAGLAVFLTVHLAYTIAFLSVSDDSLQAVAFGGVIIFAAATFWLMKQLWPGLSAGLRLPVQIYAILITLMVGAGFLVLGGPVPAGAGVAAVAGAVLFYVSDAILAWHRFGRALRNYQTLNLSFYWAGQFLVAVSARWILAG